MKNSSGGFLELPPLVAQFVGSKDSPICVLTGVPSWDNTVMPDAARNMLVDIFRKAGIGPDKLSFYCVSDFIPPARNENAIGGDRRFTLMQKACRFLADHRANVFVPLGNLALETLTNYKSIDKWQLSVIPATNLANRKCLPMYSPEHVYAIYKDMPFLLFGAQKLRLEMESPKIKTTARSFTIAPSYDQVATFMGQAMFEECLSVDIETAYGQITAVGVATSPHCAISIPTLPHEWPNKEIYHRVWTWINDVMASPAKKVFQNFIYDCTYFSSYGILVNNLWHDTMLAQKFLYPELPMGLDTIARIYTGEAYWKDEGKDWKDTESKDKTQFWAYNAKDCAVTMEAAYEQVKQLKARGLEESFKSLVMDCAGPAAEMCWRGLPVSPEARDRIIQETTSELAELYTKFTELAGPAADGKPINPRSPKQLKDLFKARGYRIPIKKGKESSDQTAILKLQHKHPKDPILPLLLELSEKNKLISSYLKPSPYPDGRFRFSLNLGGTDSGRWSCRKDAWGNGINAQTISGNLKNMFVAPAGWLFVECDLKQADSRFVAWDAPEPTLIKFYSEGVDIHKFVAARPELFNKPVEAITKQERQLGKTVGHASNYGMRGGRLSDICLLNMNLVLDPTRADRMLEGYHRVFPGIRMWQQKIAAEIKRTKELTTPLGRRRQFFDRIGDDLFRVAYSYRPQSTVVDVVNCLMRFVDKNRTPELCHFALQVHDSLVLLVHETYLENALDLLKAENEWNPKLPLAGGVLQIPIEIKVGPCWGKASHVYG